MRGRATGTEIRSPTREALMDHLRVTAGLAAGCAVLALGGCAARPGPAGATASRFDAAVGRSDWSAACAMLAPVTRDGLEQSAGIPCRDALEEEGLERAGPVLRVEVFGTMAQARMGQDTVFLARFPGGWKVLAAGCSPQAGRPYDCRLQGG
jgi:hypothetical protein